MNERFIQEVLSYLPKKIPQTMRDFFYMALSKGLVGKKVYFDAEAKNDVSNEEALSQFLASKTLEGCSERTTKYYRATIQSALKMIQKSYLFISASDII